MENIEKESEEYIYSDTIEFVTVVCTGFKNVPFPFFIVLKGLTDTTGALLAAPSNSPYIGGCLRCACGSA